MSEQIGWRGFVRRLRDEAPAWAIALPQMPRLVQQALARLTPPAPSATPSSRCCTSGGARTACSP